jgi:hypothetical protein
MNILTLPHEELMQEESLKHADLPQDIREDIEELEELKSEYKEYPSEAGKNELIKESIAIADTIQDWLERDLPEDENVNVDKIESKTEEFVPTWKFW